jgi:hypothetical protein
MVLPGNFSRVSSYLLFSFTFWPLQRPLSQELPHAFKQLEGLAGRHSNRSDDDVTSLNFDDEKF